MNCGYIITPLADGHTVRVHPPGKNDFVICADGGYLKAVELGIKPHLAIGDFDSMDIGLVTDCPLVHVAREKDETDTFLCIQRGMEMGCCSFQIIGGLGGRLDHTMANVQLMAWGAQKGIKIVCLAAMEEAFILLPGQHFIAARRDAYLSFFAYSQAVSGLTLQGVAYPLKNAEISCFFPLCVSNRFIRDVAEVSFDKGLLLGIISQENKMPLRCV